MVTLVVAVAKNRAIGLNNQLPWHLPEDLQHFKKTTLGHTLIMGRKTFDSIGKPLPGRRIIVLTKNRAWQHEGCETASDLTQALNLAKSTPERQAFIVGGAAVYEQALSEQIATQIIMTEIDLARHNGTSSIAKRIQAKPACSTPSCISCETNYSPSRFTH
jgi:dihydrofolate reductase